MLLAIDKKNVALFLIFERWSALVKNVSSFYPIWNIFRFASVRNLWYVPHSRVREIYGPPICAFTRSKIDRSRRRGFVDMIIDRTTTLVVSNALNCGQPPRRRYGWWECYYRLVPCSRSLYNYEDYEIPYECTHPCTAHVVKERIAKSCCEREKCAMKVPDTACLVGNEQCRAVREEALSAVSDNQRETCEFDTKLRPNETGTLW